jgi:hypothetical protein
VIKQEANRVAELEANRDYPGTRAREEDKRPGVSLEEDKRPSCFVHAAVK